MKFISPTVHGILDYLTGILLLLAPNLFGFDDDGGAAAWIPRIVGIAILGMALLTRYRPGLLRVIPFSLHLMIDYFTGAFLAASPFIFGFSQEDNSRWMPHLITGLAILLISFFSRNTESEEAVEIQNRRTNP